MRLQARVKKTTEYGHKLMKEAASIRLRIREVESNKKANYNSKTRICPFYTPLFPSSIFPYENSIL